MWKCWLECSQYSEGKVIRVKSQVFIKYSMTLSIVINRLFSLAMVQMPVVVNMSDTAMMWGRKEVEGHSTGQGHRQESLIRTCAYLEGIRS